MSARRTMSDEDRILWSAVAETVAPLKPRRPVAKEAPPEPAAAPPAAKPRAAAPAYAAPPQKPPAPAGQIDRQTTEKLAKGRLPLEARIDLHGMRQDEAHALLLSFVSRAHQRGVRYVLVITGKGPGGDGVLRRSAPQWLKTPPFRAYVSGLDQAARGHGCEGALYVRIKKPKGAA